MTDPAARSTTRPSWPLLVMAGLAFVPVLGFGFGSIAATWGLIASHRHAKAAAAVGASGALLNVAAVFLWANNVLTSDRYGEAREVMVVSDLGQVVAELEDYRADKGSYPATLEDLVGRPIPTRMVNIYDNSNGVIGHPTFEYRRAPDGRSYDLFAAGADRKPGTDDDLRPVIDDSSAAPGYRPEGT